MESLLATMVPRYASILDQHIPSIQQWQSAMIHAVHHLLLTVIQARDYLAPYATGQPLQWLIEHIVRILSEQSLIEKVQEKAENPETILIDSAIRTLATFVHEPELLAYIKQLKITAQLRSLMASPYESIVLHTYVLLSYTLEEDDIKASEKESGRFLSNLFDSLRKKLKSLPKGDKHDEWAERSVALLVEALQGNLGHEECSVPTFVSSSGST